MYQVQTLQLVYADGRTYNGQTIISLTGLPIPHGYGTMTNAAGSFYRGTWNQNLRHGTGQSYDASTGRSYCGGFLDDREEGYAVVSRPGPLGDQRMYEGYIVESKREGWGRQTEISLNGTRTIFEGTWEDDVMEGWGKYTIMGNGSNEMYEGTFVDGILQGQGYMVDFLTGQRYRVTFTAGGNIMTKVSGWA
jgi:hypothetical protein